MRLYAGTSKNFIEDTIRNQIAEKLRKAFFDYYRHMPPPGEMHAWTNSLVRIKDVVQRAELTDHGIILEYQLPLSSKRLDFLVCGKDGDERDNAVIVELKQWSSSRESVGMNEVSTLVGGGFRDMLHPSAQVSFYRQYLQDTHTAFYDGPAPVLLHSCAYLHNYPRDPGDVIFAPKFAKLLDESPVFTADDFDPICEYLRTPLVKGDGMDVLRRVEESKYRPSKKLMDHVAAMIGGNPQYVLLDEQRVVYDKIMGIVEMGFHRRKKFVVIVRGGPGTGKSVIAINLMSDLLKKGFNAQYATGSRAFTETLRNVIGRRGSVQFKYFNSYAAAQPEEVDVLICDESHRIRETSNSRFTKIVNRSDLPQVEELIRAARVCVFFIDDDQVVRPGEIGSTDYLKNAADKLHTNIDEYTLDIQFRCAGSEAFIGWIENTLGIHRTPYALWNSKEESFDFRIFNSPLELETAIRAKARDGFSSRMTAGFCWPWSNARSDGTLIDDVIIGEYRRPWNAKPEASRLAKGIPKATLWAHDPGGIEQIGCIYTAQGFEFDYVGVIFGNDLVYRFDGSSWIGDRSHSADPVVKRDKTNFLNLVKNTYRVLLSRGLKGCYLHFLDKETERFFQSRME